MRAGSTMAIYWSPPMIFETREVAITVAMSPPADFARWMIGSISRLLKPAKSITAPKDIAPMISQMVVSMLLMPPPENSLSISGIPWKRGRNHSP